LTAAAFAASFPLAAQPAVPPSGEGEPYRSAFEGYRPFESGEVQDWRKSNDTVRDIGGWRAYGREIQGAAKSTSQPEAAGPAQGHGGHGAPMPQPANAHQGHPR
jgi:hypothetical protein